MGLFSSSSYTQKCEEVVFRPSPKRHNYKILKHINLNNNLVILIKYKDVDNYEGKKILVYENTNMNILNLQGDIDPHFSESSKLLSPVARFEPTERGWNWACRFMMEIGE